MSESMKARKGNLIVYAEDHSATSLKDGTLRWREWRVGTVGSATRDGTVKTVVPGFGCERKREMRLPCFVASFDKVNAETADRMRTHFAESSWKTAEEASAAVKAALAA
ncbi:hypothetical protein [Mesorhizobium sp. B2-8-9]|uniref:hypothetical protein n=1 Tax=Mesorhizobium sp. B2-8-9 TaxID=2589899 RepID=UPI0011281CAC|nr:hypothetical protein [Mesorhizobium sp. B2-8-9]TPI86410.1 hypothetical protein FJ423_00885 [Mesorhizobium sp. B2-8-9]